MAYGYNSGFLITSLISAVHHQLSSAKGAAVDSLEPGMFTVWLR
jgi:hypothetical protein